MPNPKTGLMAGEAKAIAEVMRLGATYGYGNLIGHLQRAWKELLIAKGLDPTTAAYHVGLAEPEIYAVHVRADGWCNRMVQIKDCYPEDSINHWVHGHGGNCLRLDKAGAVALAARLNTAFGAEGYRFDVMAERLLPAWRLIDDSID
jgi:hypothetical protein